MTKERKEWKKIVKTRMARLDVWEKSQGHKWTGEKPERNMRKEEGEQDLKCSVCGNVCKSKAGLVIHKRRMHEVSKEKKVFKCEDCGVELQQEANLLNHKKVCGGAEASSPDRRKCVCGKEYSKGYIGTHKKKCAAALEAASATEVSPTAPRVYRGDKGVCDLCGKEMAKTNISRHKREACPRR